MKLAITIFTIIIAQFISRIELDQSTRNYLMHENDSITYTAKDLKKMYVEKGFKFQSVYNHKYKKLNNYFFVFEKELKNPNYKQNRDLVICEKTKTDRYKIIAVNKNAIYIKLNSIQCDNYAESFVKIATKYSFITLEQIRCGNNSTIKEFFTFKSDSIKNTYSLNTYSVIIQERLGPDDDNHYVIEEYPVETLTEKDFGKIDLYSFNPELLTPFKKNFPKYIYELF